MEIPLALRVTRPPRLIFPMQTSCLLLAFLVLAVVPAAALPAPSVPTTPAVQNGGEAAISFNPDQLVALALRIDDVRGASARTTGVAGVRYDIATFPARAGSHLDVEHRGETVTGIGASELKFDGGLVLAYPGGVADLRGFVLRANPGKPFDIDVADAHGVVWLVADHAHYGVDADRPGEFSMRHMDLRLSSHFARMLGRAGGAGQPVGNLEFSAPARSDDAHGDAGAISCHAPWPRPGLVTDIEVTYSNLSGFWDSIYVPRCGLPPLPNGGACTASSTNGKLVLGADASLRNVGQTAVAWYGHFSGKHPPYANDQHPYLIWNLYRIDAAGRIKQIGASGVKHAFYSINKRCGCAAGNVFWPGCEDIYSFSSNDNGGGEQNLAPRSEIIPRTAQWGRCGSVWDADCDGRMDAGSGAQDLYQYRMQVTESDLLAPLSVGAQYFFEYWYVVRDDVNIYNTMGYRQIAPRKNGANWSVDLVNAKAPDHDFFLGPAINRWVDPATPSSHAMNKELATPLGRARVAVKVTNLGGGLWRYDYAVMNFDYAHARVDPAHPREPDLKLLSNHGFAQFGVALSRGARVTDIRFDDGDDDRGNDWSATTSAGTVEWTAPIAGNTLDWGTLYHFEFTANVAPGVGSEISLVGAATTDEAAPHYTLQLLGPRK